MSDERQWLRHPETQGHFNCPAGAVDDWKDMGWEPCAPPVDPNPVIAEHLAWREAEAARLEAERQTETAKPNPKSARRGDTPGELSNG